MRKSRSALSVLTEKEKQILRVWAQGQTLKEVSVAFHLSSDGVSFHLRNIYRKLKVNTAREAVRIYHSSL